MFSFISKKAIFAVALAVAVLLVLEPTTNVTMAVLSFPSKVAWTVLGFLVGIINWGVLSMMVIGFTVAFIAKTRSVDWSEVKAYFNKEEA